MLSTRLPAWVAAALVALAPAPGLSKSSLLLPYPPDSGHVPAVTFDTAGQEVGRSEFSLVELENGEIRMNVNMRIAGGAENRTWAEFERVDRGVGHEPLLRVLREESQSFDPSGGPMTLLRIDHVAGVATCTPPDASPTAIALPPDDRVANVPMNLLFLPIVRGEVERIEFQLFTCRGGAKLHPFVASPIGAPVETGAKRIVEVRYEPDLPQVMSWAAGLVMPRLSFWFDTNRNGAYVGHRMPLYSKGPEILMVRSGVAPPALGQPF